MNSDVLPDLVTPIRSWVRRNPGAVALTQGNTHISRGTLDGRSDAFAAELARHGVGIGDRVGIIGSIALEWCYTALAVLKLGATIVPMTERLSATEISAILGRVDARAVVSDADRADVVTAATAKTADARWRVFTFDELSTAGPPSSPVANSAAPAGLAVIAFTSGSTGEPKGSLLTHQAIMCALFEAVLLEPTLLRGRALDVVSLAYLGGLVNSFLGPLVFGGSVVLMPKWDPAESLELVERERVTSMSCTTIFYERMANDPTFGARDLSSVTVAIAGGSPVPVTLLQQWQAHGVVVRQGYGLTEGCSLVSLPTEDLAIAHPDVAGVGGILRTVRIVDDQERECPPGEPGQIVIYGPGIAAGYWQDPATTAKEFAGGWLHTGDIGTMAADGGLRVVGRTKDVIISGGINIYAAELERVIAEIEGVTEVAVIGVADEEFGETPAALVVTTRPLGGAEVVEHCRTRLATYKAPRYVEILDEPLPRTAIGKIAKDGLRNDYADLPARSTRFGSGTTKDSRAST
jgi:fatty-acyl-CoA synthase